MPIVKAVSVRIRTDGAADAKLKIDAVSARADELGKLDPTIKVQVDTAAASVKLAILRAELRRTAAITGAQGALGGAAGAASSGSGLLGTLLFGGATVGGVPIVIASLIALATLLTGAGGIIPLIAAAGIGLGAFGALAIPTFSKILAGVTAVGGATTALAKNQAWASIPKSLQPIVHGVLDVKAEFGKLAASLQPLVTKILGVGVSIAQKLLPAFLPIARTAGNAILGLANEFSKFASSPGFKAFLGQMEKLAGPAIKTIGEGIGRIGVSLGHLLTALINPNGLRALRLVFQAIGNGIQWVANIFKWATPLVIKFYRMFSEGWKLAEPSFKNIPTAVHTIVRAFDTYVHAGGNVVHALENVGHAMANTGHALGNVGRAFSGSARDIGNWAGDAIRFGGRVVAWFGGLPGRITSALGNLSGLLVNAGRAIIGGLISGIQSALGGLTSLVGSIGGLISGLKGPLSADRQLLVPHGQAIIGGLMAGMNSQLGALAATTAGVTGTVYGGVPGPAWGSNGGRGTVVNNYVTVNAPVGSNPRDIARQIIEVLNQGATAGMRLRPSIIASAG